MPPETEHVAIGIHVCNLSHTPGDDVVCDGLHTPRASGRDPVSKVVDEQETPGVACVVRANVCAERAVQSESSPVQ